MTNEKAREAYSLMSKIFRLSHLENILNNSIGITISSTIKNKATEDVPQDLCKLFSEQVKHTICELKNKLEEL